MKKKILFIILFFCVFFFSCKNPIYESKQTEDPNKETDSNPVENKQIVNQFFWGTWQRMDNGQFYFIDESKIVIYDSENIFIKEYPVTKSTETTLTTSSNFFTKQTDRIIVSDNIPFFRKGGTNLEYKLKLVGFEDSISRAASTINVSGISVKGKSKTFPSYEESTISDENGNIVLHAPVSGDIQTVTIENDIDSKIVVSGIKIDNNGSNFGTIPIASSNQYLLKITGTIAESDKTDGYLFANNYKSYPLTLTITNISDVDCPSNYYDITSASPYITIEKAVDSEYPLEGPISTLKPGATLTVKLNVKCENITESYIDTGLNVTFGDTKQKWIDFVPLRFHRGVVPITFAAAQNGHNMNAVLNGFIIYPDSNTKFFAVDQTVSKTLYVPSFKETENYILVFSGATAEKILSNSTEMFYTVALGTTGAKTVSIPTDREQNTQIRDFGESNDTEKNAFPIANSFEAYISSGDEDFYKFSLTENTIISAKNVPKDYWETSAYSVKPLEDKIIASFGSTGIIAGTLGNADSWVIHGFEAKAGELYKIEWGDISNIITISLDSLTEKYDGTASIQVSAYNSSANELFTSRTISGQTVSVNTDGWIYINVAAKNENGGTYTLRVTDNSLESQKIHYIASSGYAGYTWTTGELKSSNDSKLYYFFAESNTEYLLRWSDAGDGFGHTADVEVLVSKNVNDFNSNTAIISLENNDSGYTTGQKFSVDENCYVYFKIQPQSMAGHFNGTYALCVIEDETTTLQSVNEYDRETFIVSTGAYLGDNAWIEGQIFPDGYEVFKFKVDANYTYAIVWDDEGEGSGKYTADIMVSTFSDSELKNAYWKDIDSGYNIVKTVTPSEDGYVYVKISQKASTSIGTFCIAIAFGPIAYFMQNSIMEQISHNCKFNGYKISDNNDVEWSEGNLLNESDDVIYYFKREANKVYKIYVDDSFQDSRGNKGSGKYTANTKTYITTSAIISSSDDEWYPSYMDCRAFYWSTDAIEYIHIKAYDSKGIGSFAITVIDGDNKPVSLEELIVTNGSSIKEGWIEGKIDTINDRIIYRYQAKQNTYWKMFWDDKAQGSGKYTADIEVYVDASDEDVTKNYPLDNGYTTGGWYSTFQEDTILYFYVMVKGSSEGVALENNIGSYAITIVEGNEISKDLLAVTPNTTVTISSKPDINVTTSIEETKRIFTADQGYDIYKWYIDGIVQNNDTNIFEIDISLWKTGIYEIELEAKKGRQYYSSTLFLEVK